MHGLFAIVILMPSSKKVAFLVYYSMAIRACACWWCPTAWACLETHDSGLDTARHPSLRHTAISQTTVDGLQATPPQRQASTPKFLDVCGMFACMALASRSVARGVAWLDGSVACKRLPHPATCLHAAKQELPTSVSRHVTKTMPIALEHDLFLKS
jgi:hypothetical protein